MAPNAEALIEFQAAIELKHLCKSNHRETVFVHEKMKTNETVWSGHVEVFNLTGHPSADTCYVWRHQEGNKGRIMTLLGNHVINSPHRAVQAAIFVGVQPPASKFTKDLGILNRKMRKARKTIHETEINVEDLDALIQAAQQVKENIGQRREKKELNATREAQA